MSIFFDQKDQFYNGTSNLETDAGQMSFLDGGALADRYPMTIGTYVKASPYYVTANDSYITQRKAISTFYQSFSPNPAGYLLTETALSMDTGTGGDFSNTDDTAFLDWQDQWDGVNNDAINVLVTPESNVSAGGRWFFRATVFDAGVQHDYLIDPADGTVLVNKTENLVQPASAVTTNTTSVRLYGSVSGGLSTESKGAEGLKIGEHCTWNRVISLADLQAFAQVGFASINEPTGLILDWNFLVDWRSIVATDKMKDYSTNDITSTFNKAFGQVDTPWNNFSTDNPVPVFIPSISSTEHDTVTANVFSGNAGTCYIGVYPRAATAPTAPQLVAGTGAISTASAVLDGTSASDITATHPDTGTEYTLYLVQDTTGSGDYTDVFDIDYTSPTKYSETLIDIDGASLDSITAIEYSWYDSTDFNNLGSAKITGTVEVTDGSGLLETTLPTTITTAKGADGTMVLKVDDAGTIRTAAHIVTVK